METIRFWWTWDQNGGTVETDTPTATDWSAVYREANRLARLARADNQHTPPGYMLVKAGRLVATHYHA